MPQRNIRVAVAGLGVVGRETVRLLQERAPRLSRRLGAELTLDAVCDRQVAREARALKLPGCVFKTRDPQALLSRPGLDVIVEVLGGLEDARRLVVGALAGGRHVVTANKLLLSRRWPALQAARRHGARLRFEAAVGGAIPIVQSLGESLCADRVEAVYGILNGTTNYILTRVEEGLTPEAALSEAQALGFAEKDPRLDLSGQDTAQKVSVLAAVLTGAWLDPRRIPCRGIEGLGAEDVAFAREELGRAPRLLGALRLDWSGDPRVEAHVFPTLVPLSHPLAAVRRQRNAVLVRADPAGDLLFEGPGAGAGPTASAVVGDVFLLARELLGAASPESPAAAPAELAPAEDSVSPFYLRLRAMDRPGVLARVAQALGRRGISIASIHQPQSGGRALWAQVVLTTHPAAQGRFDDALADILRIPSISPRHAVLRMLDA